MGACFAGCWSSQPGDARESWGSSPPSMTAQQSTTSNINTPYDDRMRQRRASSNPWGDDGSPVRSLKRKWSAKAIGAKARPGQRNLLGSGRWIYRLMCTENIKEVYELDDKVGEGTFGKVFRGRHKQLGYHQAVKRVMTSADMSREEMTDEIYTLMNLSHPNIMKLSQMWDDQRYFWIVCELCEGPSLFERIKDREQPMSEEEIVAALTDILKAVECVHSHYYSHNDLKPDNFVYAEEECINLKMIDFGMSGGFERESGVLKGSYGFSSPESWSGVYGPEADMWSVGMILFSMMTRRPMCPSKSSEEEIRQSIQNTFWVRTRLECAQEHFSLPQDGVDLMRKMLHVDRHMRITAARALEEPYVAKGPRCTPDERDKALTVIRSMVDMFKQFGQEPMLVRASLLLMVHIAGYIRIETQAHRWAFSLLDPKGEGEISVESIESFLSENDLVVPLDLPEVFKGVDTDCDLYITYGEFLAATLPLTLRCRNDLCQKVFSLFDHNHDGFIDQNDLVRTFLAQEDLKMQPMVEACRLVILQVAPGKGRLNASEFQKVVMGDRIPIPNSFDGFEVDEQPKAYDITMSDLASWRHNPS